MTWRDLAACKGMDTDNFYRDTAGRPTKANRVHPTCATCPVQVPCLNDALDRFEPFGIWGGVTPRGRERILNRRLTTDGYRAVNYPRSRYG